MVPTAPEARDALPGTNSTSLWCEMPAKVGKPPIDPSLPLPLVAPASCCLPLHLPPGDLPQVVGQDAPANPPAHPFFSVIQAHIQPKRARENADAPLYPRPKAKASHKPTLLLVTFSFLGGFAVLG